MLRELVYRPLTSGEDLEALYRFRYRMYLQDGMCTPNASRMVCDPMDEAPGAMQFGVYLDDALVSTIRLTLMRGEQRQGPSMLAYPEHIAPMLDAGQTLIDPARFAVDTAMADRSPLLPHLTIRLAALASVHFKADYCTSVVQDGHRGFYKRFLLGEEVAGGKVFPGLECTTHLLVSRVPDVEAYARARYPFFLGLDVEKQMLFGFDPKKGPPLAVKSTAELLQRRRERGLDA
ncbi:MAG: hypothetical protein AAFO70_01105 [Pseudomonadota bacterium]